MRITKEKLMAKEERKPLRILLIVRGILGIITDGLLTLVIVGLSFSNLNGQTPGLDNMDLLDYVPIIECIISASFIIFGIRKYTLTRTNLVDLIIAALISVILYICLFWLEVYFLLFFAIEILLSIALIFLCAGYYRQIDKKKYRESRRA